jgi:hypothetical protein
MAAATRQMGISTHLQQIIRLLALPSLCLGVVVGPHASALAASTPSFQGTDFQSWDELDVATRLKPYLDVTWVARARFSTELPNPANYVFGTDWKFSVNKHLLITPSCYYFTFRTASGTLGHGQDPILAATPHFSRGRWIVSDRNRFCGRFGTNGIGPSWDYRNRPEVEHSIGPEQRMHRAWCKSIQLQLALWVRPYMEAGQAANE